MSGHEPLAATPEQVAMARRIMNESVKYINRFSRGQVSHGSTAVQAMVLAAIIETSERAAAHATSFLVGDPQNGVPLRNPMAHEIATALRNGDHLKEPKG